MWIQPLDLADRPDDKLIRSLYDTYVAAMSTDDPGPQSSLARFRLDVAAHSPGARTELWAVIEEDLVAGAYGLSLRRLDNTHVGSLYPLVVHPERRGRGLGSALFEHAVGRMRTHGRRLLLTESPATGTGARLARARGMTVSLEEARRTLDLTRADWPALKRILPRVAGYNVEQWIGPAAPELMPDLATLMGGMNDAPRDGDLEDAAFTEERVADREARITLSGDTCFTTIARRDSDGAPAGYTRVYVRADGSDHWGGQADTTVLKEHRGHRLGLLLKLSNLFYLREHAPHVERLITWNANSNRHMLAINEAMGFEPLDAWNVWRLEV